MLQNEIYKKVELIIRNSIGEQFNNCDITKSTNLCEDFGLDSIQIVQLIFGIEDEFDIEIDVEEISFSDIISYDKLLELVVAQVGVV